MKLLVVMALLMGCTSTDTESMHVRWPRHRQMHDERLEKLETELVALRRQVSELEAAVKALPATQDPRDPSLVRPAE